MTQTKIVISAAALAALVVTAMMLTTSATDSGRDALGETFAACEVGASPVQVAPTRSPAEREAGVAKIENRYHADVGSLFRFEVEGETKLDLRSTDGTVNAGPALHLSGQITFGVRSRERGELLVEVGTKDLVVATRGVLGGADAEKAAGALALEIGHGALIRMTDLGELRGYRFKPESGSEARNWIRNLVDAARVTLPAAEVSNWTTREHDAIGEAELVHSWGSAANDEKRVFRKQKVRYVDHGEQRMRPVLDHAAAGTFDARLGWVVDLHTRELATMRIAEAGTTVEARATLHFVLVAAGRVVGLASGYSETESPVWGAEDALLAHREQQRSEWRRELEKVTTQELIHALLELAKKDLADPEFMAARERLVWALRLFPERIAEVVDLARGEQLSDRGMVVLLAALGSARTDAAQNALADLTTPAFQDRTRVYALRSLAQIVEPNQKAVTAVLAAARNGNTPITADTALMLLGGFVARDPRNTGSLLAMHAEAVEGKRLSTWLEAVGNAGAAEAYHLVEPHLAADAPLLREAALSALRGMPGEAALTALERRFEEEKLELLRGKAATLLAGREGEAGLRFLDRVLESEPDDEMRIAALRGVISKASKPEVRTRVERAANSDRSEKVRDYASRMLRDRG